jgi:hypothetical protein
MPTNAAAKRAKTSKRKVFSKSLSQSFFDQIEIKFGKINQYNDFFRFLKFLKQTMPAAKIRTIFIIINQVGFVIFKACYDFDFLVA